MRTLAYLFGLLLIVSACGNAATETTEETDSETPVEETTTEISVTPMPETQDFPEATITSIDYTDGTFTYELANYELGAQTPDANSLMCANSAKGQHIHLIVDTDPYIAKYEPTFDQEIADGEHYLLTFLSRSYHESIKHETAKKAMKVTVAGNNFTNMEEVSEPMLFYSRPKGTYTGQAQTENVMLDFYPVNLELGTDYLVKAEINGQEFTLDTWQPYFINGLPMGENTIVLTLVDANGEAVDAPNNPITRTITLEADPAEG